MADAAKEMIEYSALMQEDEEEAEFDCGCNMKRGSAPGVVENGTDAGMERDDIAFYMCPMHEYAERMLELLRALVGANPAQMKVEGMGIHAWLAAVDDATAFVREYDHQHGGE